MMNKLSGWDDTVVALATPPGIGAIGVIRLSGSRAVDIANELFPSKDLSKQASHTLHVGYLKDGGEILDEVVISLFKNPTSYTGEDVVEISCHGSAFVQEQVIRAIINRGARLARPGEFTQRAFLNGKLDLTQAEGVADLIASNTTASKNAALNNVRGGFSGVLKALREQLLQFSSLVELELDFSEEDVEFADRTKFLALISSIAASTKKLLDSFRLGNVVKNGVSVAIVGKPNAGKSTLLNTLLNDDRAIVSEIAGTTRDTIEEVINIRGVLFRLIDTAGIRDHTHDVIENMGVIRSREKIQQADIVLYMYDVNTTGRRELEAIVADISIENKKLLLVGNKSDISKPGDNNFSDLETVCISAKENKGIGELEHKLFLMVTENGSLSENMIVTNSRHYAALEQVQQSLEEIRAGLQQNIPADLLALDIRRCLYYLGEITGEITNEDRLDYIFSKFCIGK